MEDQNQIDYFIKKLDQLARQQEDLQNELHKLRLSAYQLKTQKSADQKTELEVKKDIPKEETRSNERIEFVKELKKTTPAAEAAKDGPVTPAVAKEKTPLEEFIGTNLLNKIGIAILVLGISYGVKYSIDHNLINPVTRIFLGYVMGVAMVLVAFKLKANYRTFSAVILSGAMASLYFITFAAYDFYALIPQGLAFAMMVLFTAFTVFASLQYDQKVIAIIGLVGAYGVPFLLSDGSGRVIILFSYITIVNAGILVLAFKKTWKALYYTAFALTWIIFAFWYMDRFSVQSHLWTSLAFSTIFFITFYITFLAYKLIQGEPFKLTDIALLLANSFIYYGFGYASIDDHEKGDLFLGLFTVFNAVLHFIACAVVFKRKEVTRETFYLVAGMVLVYLTLAVPVQLNGNWVTLIWAGESALLFWIGRTKSLVVFERLSYALVLLTIGSLMDDWKGYDLYAKDQPEYFVRMFLNIHFLTSVLVLAAFGWILKLNFSNSLKASSDEISLVFSWVMATLSALILYFAFYKEIFTFWQQRYIDSEVMVYSGQGYDPYPIWDYDLNNFKILFLLIYSAIFGIAISLANQRFIKNDKLTIVCTSFNAFILFLFVVVGLVSLASLRTSYINQTDVRFYFRDFRHIGIRYLSYLFMLPLVGVNRQHMKNALFNATLRAIEVTLLHIFILAVLSSELVNLLELGGIHESLKLGLSILWGAYALMLIVIGLKQKLKELRVMAIVLFSITILKLFLYDMADMSTIAKTIVMIILGVLMLIASFLYNKVKKSSQP
ncbi:membrane protein [Cytophagales bacterium WSM2-2]|nr:membrane protein [Cytophagales bacterium WSM2-2]